MKTNKLVWIIWGILLLMLALLGLTYAAKTMPQKKSKLIDTKLSNALNASQAALLTLNTIALPISNKEFSETDFSSEFA